MTALDLAASVAAEHLEWALDQGIGLREMLESVGATYEPDRGLDGAIDALAMAWIGEGRA